MGGLNSAEKEKVKHALPKASNKIIDVTIARLYIAYPNPEKWVYTGLSGAIALVDDIVGNTFFLKLIDVHGHRGVLWDQELYVNFQYNQDRTFFHTFELEQCNAGLLFTDIGDASHFLKRVQKREKYASKKTLANKNAIALEDQIKKEEESKVIHGPRGESLISDQRVRYRYEPEKHEHRQEHHYEQPSQNYASTENSASDASAAPPSFASKPPPPPVEKQPPPPVSIPSYKYDSIPLFPSSPAPPSVSSTHSPTPDSSYASTPAPSNPPPPINHPVHAVPPPLPAEQYRPLAQSPHPQFQQQHNSPSPAAPPSIPPMQQSVAIPPPPSHPAQQQNVTNNNTPQFGQYSVAGLQPPPRPTSTRPGIAPPVSRRGPVPPPPPRRSAAPPSIPSRGPLPNAPTGGQHSRTGRGPPPPPPPRRGGQAPSPPASRGTTHNSAIGPPQPQLPPQMQSPPLQQHNTYNAAPPVQQYQPPQQTAYIPPPPVLPPHSGVSTQYHPSTEPMLAQPQHHIAVPNGTAPPPAPPAPPAPFAPQMTNSAPAPPPPPPPPPAPAFNQPEAGSGFVENTGDAGRDTLLASIRGAGLNSLRKVDKSQLEKPSPLLQEVRSDAPVSQPTGGSTGGPVGAPASLADALAAALNQRKNKVARDDDIDNGDDW